MTQEEPIPHEEILKGLNTILVKQIFLEAQIDTLKRVFQFMLQQTAPNMNLAAQDEAYKNMLRVTLEQKMKGYQETNDAQAPGITAQLQELMKDLPGIVLPSLL
jgi:hypothetical protein